MSYRTRQREILDGFFSAHQDEYFTAKQLADSLGNDVISLSAIYRNLAALEKSGAVQKKLTETNEVAYRFAHSDCCKSFIHLTCLSCGKTFHMDKKLSDAMERQLKTANGFDMDVQNTTLFGFCRNCKNH